MPYITVQGLGGAMQCPSDSSASNGAVGYWMNSNLFDSEAHGVSRENLNDDPGSIVVLGDGSCREGSNQYVKNQFSWDSSAEYARRHMDGANYVFAEGHVKWVPTDRMAKQKNLSPKANSYTFRVKP